jgi:hypothetical protein
MGRMLYNLAVTLDLQRVSIGGSVFGTTSVCCCPGCKRRSCADWRH